MSTPITDWHKWHEAYDDPDSRLSRRLRVVQRLLRDALDEQRPGPIRIISMCAGEGRDVIGALADHPRRIDVSAMLVELDEGLAQNARDAAAGVGLPAVLVVTGDASLSDTYDGIAPAEIVLACGIFGNISPDDIRNTAASLPMLCAPAATVLWTRYGKPGDDLAPDIARWFDNAGFDLLELHAADEYAFRVAAQRLRVAPRPLERGVRFFTFTR